MKLKETAVGVEAIVIPQGPGKAVLELNGAYVDEGDNTGVSFFFKKLSGEKIAQATLVPFEQNSVSCKFLLEPEVCNALALDGQNVYNLSADGVAGEIRFQVQGHLAIYSQARESVKDAENDHENEQKVTPKVADVQAELKKENVSKTETYKKSLNKLILGIALVVLLLIAALVAFLLSKNTSQDVQGAINSTQAQSTQEIAKEQQSVADDKSLSASSSTGYGKCDLHSQSNDHNFMKACLGTNPSAEVLLATAKQAFQEGRCDLGARIYSSLGRSGNEEASQTYAQYFDPNNSLNSSCVKKDDDQAKYWYEKNHKKDSQERSK